MIESYTNRVGKMYITEKAYFSDEFNLIEAFSVLDIRPTRIEYRYDLLSFEIIFTSKYLGKNEEGTSLREYTISIKDAGFGQVTYSLSERGHSYED